MRMFFIGIVVVFCLTSCFGEKRFDATNQDTIKESTQIILKDLQGEKKDAFTKAVMFFIMGSPKGIGDIMLHKNDEDMKNSFQVNAQIIDGLTGNEIIQKHQEMLKEQQKVQDLKIEADNLLKTQKFEEALKKYNQIKEIPSATQVATDGIKKTQEAMEQFKDVIQYKDKIEVTEFKAERIDTYLKKNVPAVRISLKNNGDRSLDLVKITVYFQDKNGNTIFEDNFFPVNVSSYSMGRENNPLKAGYVSEMEDGKFYTIDSALSEWQEGKAILKITDIKFSEK